MNLNWEAISRLASSQRYVDANGVTGFVRIGTVASLSPGDFKTLPANVKDDLTTQARKFGMLIEQDDALIPNVFATMRLG